MPAFDTISKGISKAQSEIFEEARRKAGLSRPEAIDAAMRLFAESQGLKWPATGKHGGDRKSAKIMYHCPKCDSLHTRYIGDAAPEGFPDDDDQGGLDDIVFRCLDCGHEFRDHQADTEFVNE